MYGACGMGCVCLHISLACWEASDLFIMFVEEVYINFKTEGSYSLLCVAERGPNSHGQCKLSCTVHWWSNLTDNQLTSESILGCLQVIMQILVKYSTVSILLKFQCKVSVSNK